MRISRVKITEFPTLESTTNGQMVVVEGGQSYLFSLSSYTSSNLDPINSELTTHYSYISSNAVSISNLEATTDQLLNDGMENLNKFAAIDDDIDAVWNGVDSNTLYINNTVNTVKGKFVGNATRTLSSSDVGAYMVFSQTILPQTLIVPENDGFPLWGKVTIRNLNASLNVTIQPTGTVMISGDPGLLIVLPGKHVTLIKYTNLFWLIDN